MRAINLNSQEAIAVDVFKYNLVPLKSITPGIKDDMKHMTALISCIEPVSMPPTATAPGLKLNEVTAILIRFDAKNGHCSSCTVVPDLCHGHRQEQSHTHDGKER